MKIVVVREYARLTTDQIEATLDQATITVSAFEWLCNLSAGFNKGGASLLQVENRCWLRLDNYVGVVETPCGTLLEILPKHTDEEDEGAIITSRDLLVKMLTVALDLPIRTTDKTDIQVFNYPLMEWVMKQFVLSLDYLVKRGIRFDYKRIEEEQRYLRGQLDINKQIRQPPGRAHFFNIRHDLFLPDRPENRLLKLALKRICSITQQPDTWRLSHELAGLLNEIPISQDIKGDFRQWVKTRLMAHYQPIKVWCELILGQHMPLAVRGKTQGISLLFPMEKLFERYVEVHLRRQINNSFTIHSQTRSKYLCTYNGSDMFQLRPDLLIRCGDNLKFVVDTKWKLLSSIDIKDKYGLKQSDFYQLFAYGHQYLNGKGDMFLIYPHKKDFPDLSLPFVFSTELKLWVASFDLESDEMYWPDHFYEQLFTTNDYVKPVG